MPLYVHTILNTGYMGMNKINKVPICPHGVYVLVGETAIK